MEDQPQAFDMSAEVEDEAEAPQEPNVEYTLPGDEEAPTSSTQLAEQYPQIDLPLRVDPPQSLKAPERKSALTRDEQIRASAFSPKSFMLRGSTLKTLEGAVGGEGIAANMSTTINGDLGIGGMRTTSIEGSLKSNSENQAPFRTAVSDYKMLAFSSQRAGKMQMEGQAYLAIAITLDNMQRHNEAVDSYRKFLAVAKKMGDVTNQCLALNCLGTDCMLIACPPSEGSQFDARRTLSE